MGYLEPGLGGIRIKRDQPRFIEQRSEDRFDGIVESATLHFRGQPYSAVVINISSRGTMVECDLQPRIGETLIVEFEDCSPIHAFVRWIRDGRLGLNFGHEIVLALSPPPPSSRPVR